MTPGFLQAPHVFHVFHVFKIKEAEQVSEQT